MNIFIFALAPDDTENNLPRSALLHAGYSVSRSHACAGSIKTTAARKVVHDIFRSHVKLHPVKMENVKEGSPATALLSKTARLV